MSLLAEIRRQFDHARWADGLILTALRQQPAAPAVAVREFGHVLGTDETWLARIERRSARTAVWPSLDLPALERLAAEVHGAFDAYFVRLEEPALETLVSYTNTAGKSFENKLKDLLLHVPLHGQYHRGKVNLLLRQAGLEPAPCDYIAFIRGAPAARSPQEAAPRR